MKFFIRVWLALLLIITQVYADNDPTIVGLNIIKQSLVDIDTLKIKKQFDFEHVKSIFNANFSHHISLNHAAEFSLRAFWQQLNQAQQNIVSNYLATSIINDYTNLIVINNSDLSQIQIFKESNAKRKGNKAIIYLGIQFSPKNKKTTFSLRMVKINGEWKIYDMIISGVSLMKSYRARFNNKIKRFGIEKFLIQLKKHS